MNHPISVEAAYLPKELCISIAVCITRLDTWRDPSPFLSVDKLHRYQQPSEAAGFVHGQNTRQSKPLPNRVQTINMVIFTMTCP